MQAKKRLLKTAKKQRLGRHRGQADKLPWAAMYFLGSLKPCLKDTKGHHLPNKHSIIPLHAKSRVRGCCFRSTVLRLWVSPSVFKS